MEIKKIVAAILISSLIIVALIAVFNFVTPELEKLGQSTIAQSRVGSATQFTALPDTFVYAASTTTDAIAIDANSAGTVRQDLLVDGITKFSVAGQAKAGNATSTVGISPQISFDGVTYFNVTGNSTSTDAIGDVTGSVDPLIFSFAPGVTTSSFAYIFNIPPATHLRLLLRGDDLSTDPTDGVEAFVQVGLEQI